MPWGSYVDIIMHPAHMCHTPNQHAGFRVVNALPPDTRVSSISTGAAGESAAMPEESADSATTAEAGAKPEMMDTAGTVAPPPAAAGAGGGASWTAF